MTQFSPPFFKILEFEDRFILIGALNENQLQTLLQECELQARIGLEENRSLVVGFVNQSELKKLYGVFEPRSRKWRGQYQALAIAIVSAYQDSRFFASQ